MDRRRFATWLASVGAGITTRFDPGLSPATRLPNALPTRQLGATGLEVPILGLGGFHLGQAGSAASARSLVDAALDEGIRFFDTAESYQSGVSERWLGAALRGRRDRVVLMSKTFAYPERTRASARRHLEGSLARLGVDFLDIWQLHSVRSVADVDRAFGPGGAMEYLQEARAKGLVRFLGVTGHANPDANRRALEYWDRGLRFDVMQMPINPIDYHQQSFQRIVLPELVRRQVGVIAMKTSADGRLVRDGLCTEEECLHYVWSQPVSLAVVGMERAALVRENAGLARTFRPLSAERLQSLRARLEPQARLELEWYKQRP
jgi:aryl-alcohol dehydrogenase-like predicted oxidoreductase